VRHRRSEDAEPAGPGEPAQDAEQHGLRLDERPRRPQAREGARAQERRQRGAVALQRGDPLLHQADDLRLAEEDGRAVGQARDEDLVVAGRCEPVRVLRSHARETDGERRAPARLRFDPDAPAVELDELS